MSLRLSGWAAVLVAGVITAGVGCKSSNNEMNKSSQSLYDRLGGQANIAAVVNDLVDRAAKDPKVNFVREGQPNHWNATPENVQKLKEHVTQFIVQATGGPAEYHGADMATVHKGMHITDAEFSAFADDLVAAMNDYHVPDKEQKDLLAAVGGLKDQIVGQ